MAPGLLSLILLALAVGPAISSVAAENKSTEFVRRSCGATLYPDLCWASLSPYAAAVQQSPLNLAAAAANVSLGAITEAALRAAALLRRSGGRTARELTKQSAAELRRLVGELKNGGPGLAWRVSNALTWMSAALTNEDTCLEGLNDCSPPAEARSFCGGIRQTKMYTSNALALVLVSVLSFPSISFLAMHYDTKIGFVF
ncbi:21 kDa protein [Apostasia shenzhenica]|uniref:21 kDa protein n=1 Tax=Apostasia shenzhenica TaxID=1088818 RepID=A0A2I0A9I4_9ASPA|nr:21 kDa protein [Apostasia shenzhenica]